MSATIDSQVHPMFLNFRSKWLEDAYGVWDFDRLKSGYYQALGGAAVLMAMIFGLDCLILGRFEWYIFWIYIVASSLHILVFYLLVKMGNVSKRSQLDVYGGLFVAIGQVWQFLVGFKYPELGGQFLMASVILSIMGNCGFTSINYRVVIPVELGVMAIYLAKVLLWDEVATPEMVFQATMVLSFTSIGMASAYIMERTTRLNFLHQYTLERKQQELISKNKELEQFAYIASHDLQEPLRSVTSFSQLIDEEYRDKIGAEGAQYLDYLIEASGRMRNLITGLLDYSRLGREAQLGPVDADAVFNDIRIDLSAAIHECEAKLTSTNLPVIVGFETEFRLLLQNLILNAIKFRRAGVVPIVRVSAKKVGNDWEFSVQDNGIGIAAEHHEKIFLIFQRIHNRSLYEGTGIGLANCRKIVELHGGTIRVESEKNKGSNFIFTIPIR